MSLKLVALVPMRHDSERVPGKNYRLCHHKPLYHWIVNALLACEGIDSIVIDTDSQPIKKEAPTLSDRVKVIDRPENLRSGFISMNEVLLHDISLIKADYFLQTHSTNPLLKPETIDQAIKTFFESREHDSLFGVTRYLNRLWDKNGGAINHNPEVLERTQDLPPIYEENSNIYIFRRDTLVDRNNRIGKTPILFEIPRHEALDIDEELDFKMAEFLLSQRETGQ